MHASNTFRATWGPVHPRANRIPRVPRASSSPRVADPELVDGAKETRQNGVDQKLEQGITWGESKGPQSTDAAPMEKSAQAGEGKGWESGKRVATIFGTQLPTHIPFEEQFGNTDGGGPRFVSPYISGQSEIQNCNSLPLMIYFPGLDGTGLAASRAFPGLAQAFELNSFIIPTNDRTDFSGIVDIAQEHIEDCVKSHANGRPIYLLGESFGGLVAMALADRCKNSIDRIVLVNPATSFEQSVWPTIGPLLPEIPKNLYGLVPFAVSPLLGNPVQLAMHNVDRNASPEKQAGKILQGVMEIFGTVGFLQDLLTPEILAWKLNLLQQGSAMVKPLLPKVDQRVLVVAGEGDWLLPSEKEAQRLTKILRRGTMKVLPGRSHAILQEADVDLVQIIKEEGFYVTERRLSSPAAAAKSGKMNSFGAAGPIELPTPTEMDKAAEGGSTMKKLTSPVFLSTLDDGTVVEGLDGVPSSRPILFVGNHQTFAPDTGMFVEHMLRERDILVRGLAHPAVSRFNSGEGDDAEEKNGLDTGSMTRFLTTFGAVPVSGRNLHKLLSNQENILLYPGGAREALKMRGEKYQLFWPEKSEFVRMAAKFGATIIPLSTIGVEDSFTIMLDGKDLLKIPILREYLKDFQSKIPKARTGTSFREGMEDNFIQPIPALGVPERFYFLMGKPIETSPDDYNDREKCDELYREVKSRVEGGLSFLLEKRENDPYREFLPRILFEAAAGGKPAPTFKL